MGTIKLDSKAFDIIVQRAIRRIPEAIRGRLDNLLITVQKRPSKEVLDEMGLPPDEPLLGLYTGIPLCERTLDAPPLYPDTILLFKEPLEEMCETVAELEEEIAITLVHEIAHALGIGEERLVELGYG